jgi:di/tricarboxylate transporter
MIWEAWVACTLVLVLLVALVRNEAAPDLLLVGGLAVLSALHLVSDRFPSPTVLAGYFGNEGLVTVGVLFVVAAGLTETGGMGLLVQRILGRPKGVIDAQTRMMLPVMSISAFLNNTPVVALFLPVVKSWCKTTGLSPSKLYIPLSYAAILGGMCTLIGTSTNLVVQGLLIESHLPRFEMFTLAPIGIPIAAIGFGLILLTSKWLLPDRAPQAVHVQYGDTREYIVEMIVEPGSSIDGQSIEQAGLRHLPGLYLAEIERANATYVAVGPDMILRGNDHLIFVGLVSSVVDLQKLRGLRPATNQVFKLHEPRPNRRLVEAVISPTCPLVGQSIRQGRFRNVYDAVVIAVHRNGGRVAGKKIGDIVLRPGDTLLLETHPGFMAMHSNRRDFFLTSELADSQPLRHNKAWIALAILLGLVVAVALEPFTGISILPAALIAAALMVVTGCCSAEQARRSIEWSVLIAIAAAFGIGKSLETTGAAKCLADGVVHVCRPLGPIGVLGGIYLLTLVLTEIVTNNAAAVLAFPLAKAAAASMHVQFMPFAVAIAIAASAGFATPMGYQTHLMVYAPGNYRFSDFLKVGLPLDLVVMAVALALIPLVFPF